MQSDRDIVNVDGLARLGESVMNVCSRISGMLSDQRLSHLCCLKQEHPPDTFLHFNTTLNSLSNMIVGKHRFEQYEHATSAATMLIAVLCFACLLLRAAKSNPQ